MEYGSLLMYYICCVKKCVGYFLKHCITFLNFYNFILTAFKHHLSQQGLVYDTLYDR